MQLFRSKRDKQIPGRIFSSKQAGCSVCFFYEYERVVVRFLAGADDAFKSVFHYSLYRKREKDEGKKSERRVNIVSMNLYALNQTRCHSCHRRRRLRRGRLIIPLFSLYIAFFLLGVVVPCHFQMHKERFKTTTLRRQRARRGNEILFGEKLFSETKN